MAVEAMNPDGSNRTRLDQLPRQAALAGWPTPQVAGINHARGTAEYANRTLARTHPPSNVALYAQLAGWPTPTALERNAGPETHKKRRNFRKANANQNSTLMYLNEAAQITVNDELCAAMGYPLAETQPMRLCSDGTLLTGSTAGMASGGRLNPAHSRWLIRLPPEWDDCAPTATPSTRKPRRNSSER